MTTITTTYAKIFLTLACPVCGKLNTFGFLWDIDMSPEQAQDQFAYICSTSDIICWNCPE